MSPILARLTMTIFIVALSSGRALDGTRRSQPAPPPARRARGGGLLERAHRRAPGLVSERGGPGKIFFRSLQIMDAGAHCRAAPQRLLRSVPAQRLRCEGGHLARRLGL